MCIRDRNNTPARAREVVSRRLSALGVRPEEDITLAVAPRSECGALYQLCLLYTSIFQNETVFYRKVFWKQNFRR